jgi:hypothetical protein
MALWPWSKFLSIWIKPNYYQNGHRGLASQSIGFSIPSIIVPHDRVVVLYPEAAMSTSSLAITTVTPFAFDRWLFFPSAAFCQHTSADRTAC